MKKKNWKIPVFIAGLFFFTGLTAVFILNGKSRQSFSHQDQLNEISELIKKADSLRYSETDMASDYYNKAISFLQREVQKKGYLQLLASSYLGLAGMYVDIGEFNLALKNDSLAMEIATRISDNKTAAKAILIKGIVLFRLGEYESALDCFKRAMDWAVKMNDLELQAKVYAQRAAIWSYQGDNQKAVKEFKEALELGKQVKNKRLIAGNYMNLAVALMRLSQNDSVVEYFKNALNTFREINDKNGELLCYLSLGNYYFNFSDFGMAIEYFEFVVRLASETNDKTNIARGYHNLAEVYRHIGDNKHASDLLFRSIKIKEQINDKYSLAKGYSMLGKMFYDRDDYKKAMFYLRKSLRLFIELESKNEIGSDYNSIANVLSESNQKDSVFIYYNKALSLYKETRNKYGMSNIYVNLGDEYLEKKDYFLSEKYLLKALEIKKEISDEEEYAIVNQHLANLYLKKALESGVTSELYLRAEEAGLESFNTAKRLGTIPIMRDASGILKQIYQKQGKYLEALAYSEIFNSLSDSIFSKDKVQALTFAEARWNVEKKQEEISTLEKTRRLQQEIIQRKEDESRQQKIIIWSGTALLIFAGISVFLFALYIRKKRDARYQKQVADMTTLRMENVRNRISPHFIFNILQQEIGSEEDAEKHQRLSILVKLLRQSLEMTENLSISLAQELNFVKNYLQLQQINLGPDFQQQWKIDEKVNTSGIFLPAMMIQIPVENSVKHALLPLEGDKILKITVERKEEFGTLIVVTDNGLGYNPVKSYSSNGTGTGMKVMHQTIQLLNSRNKRKITLMVEDLRSTGGRGTKMEIVIPDAYSFKL
ncbi:MAG: tetratricopeptide repeat protein [Mangrovibacterium sp.]